MMVLLLSWMKIVFNDFWTMLDQPTGMSQLYFWIFWLIGLRNQWVYLIVSVYGHISDGAHGDKAFLPHPCYLLPNPSRAYSPHPWLHLFLYICSHLATITGNTALTILNVYALQMRYRPMILFSIGLVTPPPPVWGIPEWSLSWSGIPSRGCKGRQGIHSIWLRNLL